MPGNHRLGGVVMAVITLVYGFMMYLPQKDMKRPLASVNHITQLAYIFRVIKRPSSIQRSLWTAVSRTSLTTRSAKSLFFPRPVRFSYSCGTCMLPRLRGLSKRYPLGVGFCGCAGDCVVPPLNGFSVNS